MSEDRRSGNWIAIAVALITVGGSIGAAIITSGRTFDQKFREVSDQVVDLKKDLVEAKQGIGKLSADTRTLADSVTEVRKAPKADGLRPEPKIRIAGGPSAVGDGHNSYRSAECPPHHVLVGGGCLCGDGLDTLASYPERQDLWTCWCDRPTPIGKQVAYALCLQ